MNKDNPYEVTEVANQSSSMQRGLRPRWPLVAGAIGFVLVVIGFFYGVVMVGVPYQDPTPEIVRREAFHNSVSAWTMAFGGFILLLSILAFVAIHLYRLSKRFRGGPG